jgi:hypothetical protein
MMLVTPDCAKSVATPSKCESVVSIDYPSATKEEKSIIFLAQTRKIQNHNMKQAMTIYTSYVNKGTRSLLGCTLLLRLWEEVACPPKRLKQLPTSKVRSYSKI